MEQSVNTSQETGGKLCRRKSVQHTCSAFLFLHLQLRQLEASLSLSLSLSPYAIQCIHVQAKPGHIVLYLEARKHARRASTATGFDQSVGRTATLCKRHSF